MKTKALFLDRDGVINIDKKYVHKIEDFEFCEGIFELCKFFQKQNFLIFVVTNQSGIARAYYNEKDFEILSSYMLDEFLKRNIKIAKIYHCPHLVNCECRKPKPGMLLKAQKEFNLDLSQSFFIGDNLSDMQAGINAGVKNLFLINEDYNDDENYKVFKNLKELLRYLKDRK
ncbi:D-glycero-alpha-D-manno-heptose-1,7-bisphosphate 7-phosphatase [Campylobacter lari]|uniref:D-glycero-alpha-D-manno-heptose-1,7-bisphosphate 7-phosphatase n=1 Tax=Campylobacter lari TaxID=201 RepID=UPI001289C802|nr:HAD family hydrolase [Campylobacter lari]EAK0848311.1 HAD family hydrolase [Campylobacter lari]EAK0980205.1 HAD family hydrolase [Campylobacter lari]MCR6543424.1 HAD family hydrolase [Campylobacter lari]